MTKVHMDSRKWPDRRHWQYTMTRLGEDEHGVWLHAPPETVAQRGDEPPRQLCTGFVSLVPVDQWWITEFYWRHHFHELYVNIGTPPTWYGDAVHQIDLDRTSCAPSAVPSRFSMRTSSQPTSVPSATRSTWSTAPDRQSTRRWTCSLSGSSHSTPPPADGSRRLKRPARRSPGRCRAEPYRSATRPEPTRQTERIMMRGW